MRGAWSPSGAEWGAGPKLTVRVLEENGQHLTAVELVGIKRHLGLQEEEEQSSRSMNAFGILPTAKELPSWLGLWGGCPANASPLYVSKPGLFMFDEMPQGPHVTFPRRMLYNIPPPFGTGPTGQPVVQNGM